MRKNAICGGLALLLILGLLTGCGGEKTPADSGMDYNQYIYRGGTVCQVGDVCILLNNTVPESSVMYALSLSGSASPEILCARADCTHLQADCSARVPATGVYAWKGQLYYLAQDETGEYGVYRMEADGTGRSCILALPGLNPEDNGAVQFSSDICGGRLLLSASREELEGQRITLSLYSLAEPEAEPVTVYTADSGIIGRCWLREEWLFYMYAEEGAASSALYAYRIDTGETSLVASDWTARSVIALEGDTLYWCTFNVGAFSTDLNTGECVQYCQFPQLTTLGSEAYDDQYLYLANVGDDAGAGGLSIRDYEGQELLFLPYDGLRDSLIYEFSTPERVYFSYTARSYDSLTPVCYLDKAAIAEGTAEFIFLDTDN